MSDAQPTASPTVAEPDPIELTPSAAEAEADDRDAEPTGRPSVRRRVVLGAVVALALIAAGSAGPTAVRVIQQKNATLSTPETIGGLTRDDRYNAVETAEYLRNALAADVDLAESVGAVYADPADSRRSILIFGGTALLWEPEQDLDRAFEVLSDNGGAVAEPRAFSPGALGGIMKCGSTDGADGDMAVCGWADHGSLGLAMFPGRGVDESAALLREMRQAVQSRP